MNGLIPQQLQLLSESMIVLLLSAISSLLSVGIYVVTSLSLHAMAKGRFIEKAWLAWIPVGNLWILGSIADHYQLCARGRVKSRRKVLMAAYIVMAAILVGMIVVCFQMVKDLRGVVDLYSGRVIGDWWGAIGNELIWLAVLYLLVICAAIVQLVFAYICYYDLFRSCDPKNAVIYLVLSIVFSFLQPVFLFACRHKQLGLAPSYRKPVPTAAEPWR
jgi:hypothetical protein